MSYSTTECLISYSKTEENTKEVSYLLFLVHDEVCINENIIEYMHTSNFDQYRNLVLGFGWRDKTNGKCYISVKDENKKKAELYTNILTYGLNSNYIHFAVLFDTHDILAPSKIMEIIWYKVNVSSDSIFNFDLLMPANIDGENIGMIYVDAD